MIVIIIFLFIYLKTFLHIGQIFGSRIECHILLKLEQWCFPIKQNLIDLNYFILNFTVS